MLYISNITIFIISAALMSITFLTLFHVLDFNNHYLFFASIAIIIVSYLCYAPIDPNTQDSENLRMYGIVAFIMGAISFTLLALVFINNFLLFI